jgi:DNA helicase-2/ATP-dependent DNA helicase PcrA
MWKEDKTPEAPGRLDNLKELINAMADFENLQGFLEHIALVMEAAEGASEDKVSVMTLHGAKGLEFDVVFLPGWEDGLFPNQRAMDEHGQAGLEEERRLAYVGLTRARKLATVCHAHRRRLYSNWVDTLPSRFLGELPLGHITTDLPGLGNPTGFGGGGGGGLAEGRRGGGSNFGFREATSSFQPRSAQRSPLIIDGSARRVESKPRPSAYAAGCRVFHAKFGSGVVMAVDGDKLDIEFDHAGRKTVLDSFIKPA